MSVTAGMEHTHVSFRREAHTETASAEALHHFVDLQCSKCKNVCLLTL